MKNIEKLAAEIGVETLMMIMHKLAKPEGMQKLERVAHIIAGELEDTRNEFLKPISSKNLTLDACDGTRILKEANDVFRSIDSTFEGFDTKQRGQATAETSINVYDLKKDATSSQMFGLLSPDVRRLCFTQEQS